MLKVEKIIQSVAKLPTVTHTGLYEIYSAEDCKIASGITRAVSTGIAIRAPTGFQPLVQSNGLAAQFGLEASSYHSLVDVDRKFMNNDKPSNLFIVYLHNKGKTDVEIRCGDAICNMMLVRSRAFPILEVTEINANDDSETNKIAVETPDIPKMPKTHRIWFIKKFRENRSDVEARYLDDEMMEKIEEFKLTEVYMMARNKETVLSNFVYKNLRPEVHEKIANDFEEIHQAVQRAMLQFGDMGASSSKGKEIDE